jgi:putative ABC transport system substrate-binding protein
MRRRDFIAALSGVVAFARSRFARAQTASPGTAAHLSNAPLVGFLNSASPVTYRFTADAFRDGLAQAGFVEGRNVRIEERWANADYSALPALAAELVAKGVVAIVATGDVVSARAAKEATASIPVVFTIGGDPVHFGLVQSFNRPGANVTGVMFAPTLLGAKRVQLLREIVPKVTRIALLMNPDNANAAAERTETQEGAAKLGIGTIPLNARNAAEIETAFAELVRAKADAVLAATDPVMLDRREQIAALAARHALPSVSFTRQFAVAGGLMSYGPNISWMYRQAGGYIGQILRGAKTADMPVIQSTHFELVVNLNAARRLGLKIPSTFLAIVDEAIQ